MIIWNTSHDKLKNLFHPDFALEVHIKKYNDVVQYVIKTKPQIIIHQVIASSKPKI